MSARSSSGARSGLILRVDRTDPAKNAVAGFAAFGRLLQRRPDLRGRVGMLALLDPSRQGIAEYAAYRRAVEAEAAAVNAAHATDGWLPVVLHVRDDFPSSVAGYLQYDVLLVNSVMDGLDLVAEEAPLINTRDGVLVLSRCTGAWEALEEWAIGLDPHDIEGTSAALERALELPAPERRARLAGIRARVLAHGPADWADARTGRARRPQYDARVSAIPLSAHDELVSVDPATLDEVGRVAVTELSALGEIVSEARFAQRAWAREPLEERARLLRRAARTSARGCGRRRRHDRPGDRQADRRGLHLRALRLSRQSRMARLQPGRRAPS